MSKEFQVGRKFYKVSQEQYSEDYHGSVTIDIVKLPERGTEKSAGYDFFAPYGFTLNPGKVIKIPTGIRVVMPKNNFLMIVPRSSLGFKHFFRLANTAGIIDADYSEAENEGHIWIKIRNEGESPMVISQGEAIAQGIFMEYFTTDNDTVDTIRVNGLGSTNTKE